MNRERAMKVVLVLLGLLFCAGVYPLVLMVKEEPALDDAQPLRYSRHFPAACIPQPVRQSEPDRVHGMVKLRARRSHGSAGISTLDRSQGTDWVGCARCHWGGTDRVDSGKTYETANRGGIGGCVGCSVALPASYPAAAPRLDPRLPTIPEK